MADFARTQTRQKVVDFTLPINEQTHLTFLLKKFPGSEQIKTIMDLAKIDTMRFGFIGFFRRNFILRKSKRSCYENDLGIKKG